MAAVLKKQLIQPFKKLYNDIEGLTWCLDIAYALHHLHTRTPAVIHRFVRQGGSESAAFSSSELSLVVTCSRRRPACPAAHLLTPAYDRDIKTENILLVQDDELGRQVAKLGDFGLHVVSGVGPCGDRHARPRRTCLGA